MVLIMQILKKKYWKTLKMNYHLVFIATIFSRLTMLKNFFLNLTPIIGSGFMIVANGYIHEFICGQMAFIEHVINLDFEKSGTMFNCETNITCDVCGIGYRITQKRMSDCISRDK